MKLNVTACAKINLTLDIVGVRNDGYHLLNMIMQSVSLADKITVETVPNGEIIVTSSIASLGGTDDIAYKAANLFFMTAKISSGVNIHIDKHIPCAAGLGGGSADAAAVLLALNKIFDYPLTDERLEEISLTLGADVPYFLHGGTVSVTGIGENFRKLNDMPNCYIVIAKNAIKPSTAEMYRQIDDNDFPHPKVECAELAIDKGDYKLLCESLDNMFAHLWNCEDLVNIMECCGADSISLSGSGPSYFALFSDKDRAEQCLNTFAKNDIKAYLCNPTKKAIIIE